MHSLLLSCLAPQVSFFSIIDELDHLITSIELPDWFGNDACYEEFNFSSFVCLQFLVVGKNSFGSVKRFQLNGMSELRSLNIGSESFTGLKDFFWMDHIDSSNIESFDESKSFHIVNCALLEVILIEEFCFCDFAGEFELRNLPSLRNLVIGNSHKASFNFCCSSCVIEGFSLSRDIYLQIFQVSNNYISVTIPFMDVHLYQYQS